MGEDNAIACEAGDDSSRDDGDFVLAEDLVVADLADPRLDAETEQVSELDGLVTTRASVPPSSPG